MHRYKYILFFIFATIILIAAGNSYGQTLKVPIPNPEWPLDSVVNSSVHFYTVHGDPNYADSSSFVWIVSGGRLFYDKELTRIAGDGAMAVVQADKSNVTKLWVVWDSFDTPLDTGYVYVYEISNNGCQRSEYDAGRFQGMRIKVSSPPDARFIVAENIVCNTTDSARVIIAIDGMPPFDLKYSLNNEIFNIHVNPSDLTDLDGDGLANNISFFFDGFKALTTDMTYYFELLEVSSGGVKGHILDSPTHNLIAHVNPSAPKILSEWTEVTAGYEYAYHFENSGVNPVQWNWTLEDNVPSLLNERGFTTDPVFQCLFNNSLTPGKYSLRAQYSDNYGCVSPFDKLNIELFGLPTIAFSDSTPNVTNCSATVPLGSETFDFIVEYTGATTYSFHYEIYDYNGILVGTDNNEYINLPNRTNIISIKNTFINDIRDPEMIRPWKVVITRAQTEDSRVNVNILKGRDERVIMIYPKPFVHDDIDFAN